MPFLSESFTSYGASLEPPPRGWSSIIGIVTAICGNILISFALNTQRYAHIRIDREHKNRHDPEASSARKHLSKSLRNYGTAIQQEEAAEERQRINESVQGPEQVDSEADTPTDTFSAPNGKSHHSDDTLREDQETDDEQGGNGRKSYLKSPWWWLGIVLMTIGETGNFLAYGFAPASIVSPLGVVALISNCLIAPLMLKERFRQRDFWGVAIAIAGAVTVVLSANTSEKKLGPHGLWADVKRWEFLAYVLITAMFIAALMFASPRYGQRTILIDLGLVGLYGGYTVLSTKGVASLLSTSLYKAFEYPILYVSGLVLVLSAVMQIRYLNRALQNFDSTQVIPVQFVLFTLSVIIGSAVLYRDFERTDLNHALKFIFGCLLTFSGVYLITSGRKQEDDDDDATDVTVEDAEQIHLLDEERVSTPRVKQEPRVQIEAEADAPQTPRPVLSRSSSTIPSIAVTPATSAEDLNQNPWISSTDDLARMKDDHAPPPQTPVNQPLQAASASQTPFFTPHTSAVDSGDRTNSSPARPETLAWRGALPVKPSSEDLSTSKRASLSRLLPGPILQPLSGSLSGIVADRILKGEGTASPTQLSLRRNRSNRESARLRAAGGPIGADPESGLPLEFASESSVHRARDTRRAQEVLGGEDSPLLTRTGSHEVGTGLSGGLKKTKGRLRSMSETLSSLMSGQRKAKSDSAASHRSSSYQPGA